MLNKVLLSNAVTTLPFAVALMVFATPVTFALGLSESMWVVSLGIALLLFSITAWWCARQVKLSVAIIITLLDALWFVASVFILLFDPSQMTFVAKVLVFVVALWVLLMLVMEVKGLRQLKRNFLILN